MSKDVFGVKWRVGRKLGRTIYAQPGVRPRGDDILLGMMDAAGVASYITTLHNSYLASKDKP